MPDETARLSEIVNKSPDTIVAILRDRFYASQLYTDVSDTVLVAINPYGAPGNLNGQETLRQYTADYRQTDASQRVLSLPPHIFRLTCDAYYYMMRTGQDQSILMLGETASGKSEMRRLAIRNLIALSVTAPMGKKGSKLALQIPAAEYILEQFGHCQTLENSNASRYGKYTELQFDEAGKAIGYKSLNYYLEKERIAKCAAGDRNFHIFYALVAGAMGEEKEHLMLADHAQFRHLASHVRPSKESLQADATRFARVKQAFKAVGLTKRQVASICQMLSAILHIGNIEFYQDKQSTQDSASVRNVDTLETVAKFLGIPARALQESFMFKSKLIRNELCTVLLDVEGAANNRDEFATFLYSALFAWLAEYMNEKLCKDSFSTFVSVLDWPGSQDQARQNSLDQFVVNFANESLHRFVLSCIFEKKREEFDNEGLSSHFPDVAYVDNAECMRLITNQPGGLVHILDDQARRMPKKTDQTMVEALGKRWGSHAHFKLGPMDRSGAMTFTVNHFNGPVNYSSHNLLNKNSDVVNPEFVSLLRGIPSQSASGGEAQPSGSTNLFIRELFTTTQALNIEAHPRNEQTIVAVQQSIKPARVPSMKRPNRTGTLRRAGTQKKAAPDEQKTDKEDSDDDEQGNDDADKGGKKSNGGVRCVAGEFRSAMETLIQTLQDTKSWFVICVRPNDHQLPNQFEAKQVKQQVSTFAVTEIATALQTEYAVSMTHEEFCERYADLAFLQAASLQGATGIVAKQKCALAREVMGWSDENALIGRMKFFFSHATFRRLEDELRANDSDEIHANERRAMMDADAFARGDVDPYSPFTLLDEPNKRGRQEMFASSSHQQQLLGGNLHPAYRRDASDDAKSMYTDYSGPASRASPSIAGTEMYAPSGNMFMGQTSEKNLGYSDGLDAMGKTTEVEEVTAARRKWVAITWLLTFWVPTPLLTLLGGLKRPDVRMAWREKLAINMMIWFICACTIFVIAFLGNLICPKQHVFSQEEFQNKISKHSMTSIRGEVFNLDSIATMHGTAVPVVQSDVLLKYAGIDSSVLFPVQVNALCNGMEGSISPWVQLSSDNTSDANSKYHDFRAIHPEDTRPDWYYEAMVLMRSNFRVGFMGYTPGGLEDLVADGRSVGVYNNEVFDVTGYIQQGYRGAIAAPAGQRAPADTDAAFMSQQIMSLFNQNPGQDLTKKIDSLPLSGDELQRQRVCLRNLFFIGKTDARNSPKCQFSRYILLALSLLMVAVIGFKFLAALQFGRKRAPEDHDKFVLCQVPCYTEGEDSMRKTINSLAALKYDDKRKLLFIICDGMIVGSGNDRPTPRIVLDILGADPSIDAEPVSFLSIGEGSKQHNMAKVYSGLYEYHGHVVPYVVVVKCGKPTERHRPGNRGKRDSQLILMRFLNKVHFGTPMNPMELEIFHQIKNVIGVNPSFYEYVLQVDADTVVEPLSLNRFVSAFTNDKKVIGLCGETSISNSKRTFITMLQVYEYFISHFLAKAFESLFGSVTCLPGCFSMFRVRTPDTHRPLFIANAIVDEYSENRVDTLHTKNLLHLGEDRYLTTLVLKHFGDHKTTFVRDAKAETAVPEEWSVLLSQRRRWINSTIHNLFELLSTDGLCGFCLFSMRFIVFVDLLSTIIAPVTMVYIVYLLYVVFGEGGTIPMTSILMLVAIYGLQAILFLLNRRFDMIIWMLIYILGLPIWTLFLPLYSFWHMDDFSWGNTRVVMGEKGTRIIMHDEGTFDPSEIPQKTWQAYEEELWERNSAHSAGSLLLNRQGDNYGSQREGGAEKSTYAPSHYTASLYGMPVLEAANGSHHGSGRQSPSAPSMYNMGGGGGYAMHQATPSMYDLPGGAGGRGVSVYSLGNGLDMDAVQRARNGQSSPGFHAQSHTVATSPSGLSPQLAPSGGVVNRGRFSVASSAYFGGGPSQYHSRSNSRGPAGSTTPGGVGGLMDAPLIDSGSRRGSLGANYALDMAPLPSDDVIARDIRAIIAASNLNTVTMKTIRAQLEAKYGTSIAAKRAFVNDTIDDILGEL